MTAAISESGKACKTERSMGSLDTYTGINNGRIQKPMSTLKINKSVFLNLSLYKI